MWKNSLRKSILDEPTWPSISDEQAAALSRVLGHAGVELTPAPDVKKGRTGEKFAVLVETIDGLMAELILGKRKKDVEEEEDPDDEEEDEEEDDLEEDEDEDDEFDDEEDEDEFEEEFEDDDLDDDDDDIFYDDDDDD